MVAEKQCYTQAKPLEAEFLRDWERNGTGIENTKVKGNKKFASEKREKKKKEKRDEKRERKKGEVKRTSP